ncbi:sugar transferase [Streptomyces ureilyticus]|uniref:Sugar transferase n=1 Tax=Streptomyces ureilyticus TaxID=1775131 RepID=A0ABX0DHQ0_9ACTN|nr:sugar transferase [Streptomyces ureilyticus]NGO41092.1 sugar transferase [Streptomyces ureilyticus]
MTAAREPLPTGVRGRAAAAPIAPVALPWTLRALDLVVAVTLLVLLSPLMLFLALQIRFTSGSPVLFRQQRTGEGTRTFTLYKFRTMRHGATGPGLTSGCDPRVTATGRLFRRFHLDELPQLANVLRGDMTLVGPRPEPADVARRFPPEYRWMLQHRPGLTGPCQLRSREHAELLNDQPDPEEYYLAVMVPLRAELNAELLSHNSLTTVLRYLARTLWYVLSATWDRSGSGTRSDRPGKAGTRCTEEG